LEKYDHLEVRQRIGFLFAGYATDRSGAVVAWEAWVMLRKLAVSFAGSVVADPYLQILSALLILLISCVTTALVQPYEIVMLNLLDVAGLFVLILTQTLSIVYFYVESAEHPFMDPTALEILTTLALFLLNAVVILSLVVAYVFEVFSVRQKCARMNTQLVKVVTDTAAVEQALQAVETEEGFWWHHPADVAVRKRPARVFREDGTVMGDWNWHDDKAGDGISTTRPTLLEEIENRRSVHVGDTIGWMSRKNVRTLSAFEVELGDVGGVRCFAKNADSDNDSMLDLFEANVSGTTMNPLGDLARDAVDEAPATKDSSAVWKKKSNGVRQKVAQRLRSPRAKPQHCDEGMIEMRGIDATDVFEL
jgi:hypothetical protein